MRTKIYIPDMECVSCSKLLEKRFAKFPWIEETKFSQDSVEISFDENKGSLEEIIKTIKDAGYRASLHPFEKKTLKERGRAFIEKKASYELEHKLLKYSLLLFIIFTILEGSAYFLYFKTMPDFFQKYAIWILYLNISIATLAPALWHFLSYKTKVTCMLGMMIGMTMGMQTGMMIGAILGATNGLFVGAVVGVILGVTTGVLTGKCCGIMGILQGMMAGLMGGIMGPMTTLMLFSDHLLWFMPVYMLVNVLIVWGFSYMIYEEMVENKEVKKMPHSFAKLLALSLGITIVVLAIIIYGLRSPLYGG